MLLSSPLKLLTIMEIIQHHLLLGLLLLLLCFVSVCLAIPTTNITTDQSALLALRAHISLDDPLQILTKNWSGASICQWIGVSCSSRHYRVSALNISNMNFSGTIPPQLGNLSFLVSLDMSRNKFYGELPHELAQLRRLRVLKLDANNFDGEFPSWIGSLHEVRKLVLNNNSFTGFISPSISNMSKLAYLFLHFNSLQGNIPKEIFNISSLEFISIAGNSLFGSIPNNMCKYLGRLRFLSLSWNKLNGQIPSSLGQCLQLQILSLSFNNFSGAIPKGIGNLKALEVLYLNENKLTGLIRKEIGNATMLRVLDFFRNNITGVIPPEITNLHNLESLSLGINSLTGSIPNEIFNLSRLTLLSLALNQLSGTLPPSFGHALPNLERLLLGGNNLTGPIPHSISNSSKLHLISLSENKFTYSIPHSLGDLKYLELLQLASNNLMSDHSSSSPELGIITSLTNCKSLKLLDIYENPLEGILPDSVGNLSTSLDELHAYGCKLYGRIPDGIGNLTNLIVLSLFKNQLSGSLPTTIQKLQKLQVINLRSNQLSQVNLDCLCSLPKLDGLILENNLISGSIPECLGNVTSLRYLYLGSNRLNSTLPTNLWNLRDLLEISLFSNSLTGFVPPEIKNLQVATTIDLSMNHFTGGIPSTIGDMQNLVYLSLAYNQFEGSIPETIGMMLSLEALNLSHNSLSGKIPISLEDLKYLAYFNVSFNNLRGEIPSKGPFLNFTVESFISNEALCGDQRFLVPPCPSISAQRLKAKTVHPIIFFLLGSVIIVAGVVCFGLVYRRYRRKGKASINDQANSSLIVTHERIPYYKLLQATDGYDESNLLGTGSFGSVYRGTLDDGRVVAIKVFNLQQEGGFNSFDAECDVLRNLRHRNLTKVISNCSNPDFKALVLEYMPNGSLEKWLYSHNYFLSIMQRLDILIDVGCALQYLHCENLTAVVHCDLKPSNVLLDEAMVAHVSDFGVAKLLGHEDSITHTKTLATLCYLAPEYGMEGLVSTKCDVYSFGIMMMEVLTRRSPNNEMFGENLNLRSWVKDAMHNGSIAHHVIDANLVRTTSTEGHSPEVEVEVMACISSSIMEVALNCTRKSPRERSNIKDALVALKKIKLELLLPHTQGFHVTGSGERN